MDKTNNLQYFLTDIADAIREKKGTTDLINAQDFADEIRDVPTSGGSGDSNDEYLDLSNMSNEMGVTMLRMSALAKATATASDMTATIITPPYLLESMGTPLPIAAKINLKNKVLFPTGTDASGTIVTTTMTLVELLASNFNAPIEFFDSIPRLTESEFYNLES